MSGKSPWCRAEKGADCHLREDLPDESGCRPGKTTAGKLRLRRRDRPAAPHGSQPGADRAATGSWRQTDLLAGCRARGRASAAAAADAPDPGRGFLAFHGIVLIADMTGHETSPCQRPRLLSTAIIACPRATYSPGGIPRENLIRSRAQDEREAVCPAAPKPAQLGAKLGKKEPGRSRVPVARRVKLVLAAGLRRPRQLPCPDRHQPRPRPWPRRGAGP